MAWVGPTAPVSKLWASVTPGNPTSLLRLDGAESSRVRGGRERQGGWRLGKADWKEKGEKRAKKGGMTDKLNLSLVINPGKCSIQNEHQPEKLAAAGKCPKSFCRTRAHEWGNAA